MAPLYVIAPLSLPPGDARHVEAIRLAHDPQVNLVPPHFTLVFGVKGASVEDADAHVARIAEQTAPIAWRLDRAISADDYVFLMPAEGEAALRRLHRSLYGGPFADDLRSDIAFAPHVTVGVLRSASEASVLAEQLSRRTIDIRGRLDRLEMVAFGGGRIEPIAHYALSGPALPD